MKIKKRITAFVMAAVLSVPALLSPMCSEKAYAAGDTTLSVGAEVGYAGYSTNRMTADGNFAYCVQPSKGTPASGNYTKHDDVANYMANPGDTAAAEYLRRIAYRCYGSPGFDPSYFPSTWYDGSGMDDEKYIALSHIILADAATYEGGKAVYGCTKDFKNWAYQNVLGFNNKGEIINENAPRVKLAGVDAPQTFQIFILDTGSTQRIMGYEYHPEGSLNLVKTSANTSLTDGNSCYSLAGAVYGVYSDSGCTTQVDTLTTDGAGNSNTISLAVGTYYVKEITAPKGYAKDNETHSINVESEKTSTVRVTDRPTNDPIRITLSKIDQQTGEATQGGASLEGAEFTVKYYDGYYNSGNLPSNATRTWVIKTIKSSSGKYIAALRNEYKVSGDPFYTAGRTICVPLGTISVEETKAPTGYKLEGAYLQASGSSTKITGKYVAQVTQTGDIASLNGGNEYTISDSVERGGIAVQKYDNETSSKTPQGAATLQGAKIAIITDNDQDVVVDGMVYSKGQTVKTLTTDANGYAATKADELPYGNYIVKETSAPAGYKLEGQIQRSTVVHSNNTLVNLTSTGNGIRDNVIRGGVKVAKLDNDSGKNSPQGASTLQGAEIEIITNNDHAVVVNGKSYTKGQVVKTLTTDAKGEASTGANELPYGEYILKEIKAPNGYLVSGQIQRSFSIRSNGKIVNMTSGSTGIRDNVIRGDVQLVKFEESMDDEQDQKKPLQGITFSLTSKTTGQVYQITTDENGYASTKQLHISSRGNLVYDTYVVHETNTPAGSQPVKDFEVTISREGQTLYYILEDKNILSPLSLVKTDSETGQTIPLANAEFQILDADHNVITMTTHYPNMVVHDTFKTDESGTFTLPDKLKIGTYYIREVNAPEGYLLDQNEMEIQITEEHDWASPFEIVFSDAPAKGKITVAKADDQTGDPIEGTVFDIVAAEDIVTPDGTVRAQSGEVVDTLTTSADGTAESKELYLGKYTVQEVKQTDGYVRTLEGRDVELTYQDQNTSVVSENVSITNKPTEFHLKKVDENGDPLSGVQFAIWNKAMSGTDTENTDDADQEDDTNHEEPDTTDPELDAVDPDMGVTQTFTTDENGEILLQYLNPGTYCVKEIKADGYMIDPDIHEFTVDETGRIEGEQSYTMTLANKPTEFHLKKVDENGDPLAGVEFTVWNKAMSGTDTEDGADQKDDTNHEDTTDPELDTVDPDMGVTQTFTTDENGEILISYLSTGTYCVKETKADGYMIDPDIHEFTVDETGRVEGQESYTMTLVNQPTEFHLKKVDENGDPLSNVQFHIWNQADHEGDAGSDSIDKKELYTTDENGEILISYLSPGTYSVKETKADGYMIDPDIHEFTVDETGRVEGQDVYTMTLTNKQSRIHTKARGAESGTHEVLAESGARIIDTVSYENLNVGTAYVVEGVLMDQQTGQPVEIDGKQITAKVKFTPEQSDGSVDVPFDLDATSFAGKNIVVFEKLYQGELKVAEHQDINDADQTVYMKEIPEIPEEPVIPVIPVTGVSLPIVIPVVLAVAGAVYVGIRKRKKRLNSKKD